MPPCCDGAENDDQENSAMKYEDVSNALVALLPELEPGYRNLGGGSGDEPGPHVVFGNLLGPYLEHLLDTNDETRLNAVFAFLESLSSSPEVSIQEIVWATVCENLLVDDDRLEKARGFMGPMTLKLSRDIEDYWQRRRRDAQ